MRTAQTDSVLKICRKQVNLDVISKLIASVLEAIFSDEIYVFCCTLPKFETSCRIYFELEIHVLKVPGSSLPIHTFAYSLFVDVYSVISNMTGYSHSCHSIKLIHCGVPERNGLSDKMVL